MTPLFWVFMGIVGVYVVGVFLVVDHFAQKISADPHPEWTTTEPERARLDRVVRLADYRRPS